MKKYTASWKSLCDHPVPEPTGRGKRRRQRPGERLKPAEELLEHPVADLDGDGMLELSGVTPDVTGECGEARVVPVDLEGDHRHPPPVERRPACVRCPSPSRTSRQRSTSGPE